jgi:PAS domain-containing protein
MADANQDDAIVSALLAAAFEAIPRPLVVSDYRTIIFANESMRSVLRVSDRAEIEGRDPLDIIHPDLHEAVNERRRLLRDGANGFADLPVKLVAIDGTAINTKLSITPLEHEGFRFAVLLYELV